MASARSLIDLNSFSVSSALLTAVVGPVENLGIIANTIGSSYSPADYDVEGYDSEGYDGEGYDREGYNSEGYDRNGYYKYSNDSDNGYKGGN